MKISVKLENGLLPDKYGKYGNTKIGGVPCVSFPIKIEEVPKAAKSLALTFVDFDSIPVCGFAWTHWTAVNIPADISEISENASQKPTFSIIQGANSFSGAIKNCYGGPTPPDKTHVYTLTLYALDCTVKLSEGFSLEELNKALTGHILDKSEIRLPSRS